jgi:phytoene dehydrogenase-like protein
MYGDFDFDVIIVGGGLAGLCCARHVSDAGFSCRLVEASDRVGGRVRTDRVDGFLLDRGFQTFLTSYPEAQRVLDYKALQLQCFEPGAMVRVNRRFHRFCDPWRRPQHAMAVALSSVGTLNDKVKAGRLRNRLLNGGLEEIFHGPNTSTLEALQREGFSDRFIQRFFQPLLGGVFLNPELAASSRMFEFVFRMFATGDAALPAMGMEALPRQLAQSLPGGVIRTRTQVVGIDGQTVKLASGTQLRARAVVLAVEGPVAARLLRQVSPQKWRSVTCLYFAADEPPVNGPVLVLNGDGDGPINNLAVVSEVAPSYAPAGESLISVSVLKHLEENDRQLESRVRRQMVDWFGTPSTPWRHLQTYRIRYALPPQTPDGMEPVQKPAQVRDGLFLCGDYRDMASIQGAMSSGRRTAEAVVKSLQDSSTVVSRAG